MENARETASRSKGLDFNKGGGKQSGRDAHGSSNCGRSYAGHAGGAVLQLGSDARFSRNHLFHRLHQLS